MHPRPPSRNSTNDLPEVRSIYYQAGFSCIGSPVINVTLETSSPTNLPNKQSVYAKITTFVIQSQHTKQPYGAANGPHHEMANTSRRLMTAYLPNGFFECMARSHDTIHTFWLSSEVATPGWQAMEWYESLSATRSALATRWSRLSSATSSGKDCETR